MMRRFNLVRDKDVSGVSGTGVVAEGVELSNGRCVMAWLTRYTSVAMYDSAKALQAIHGHEGATRLVWLDTDDGTH